MQESSVPMILCFRKAANRIRAEGKARSGVASDIGCDSGGLDQEKKVRCAQLHDYSRFGIDLPAAERLRFFYTNRSCNNYMQRTLLFGGILFSACSMLANAGSFTSDFS